MITFCCGVVVGVVGLAVIAIIGYVKEFGVFR